MIRRPTPLLVAFLLLSLAALARADWDDHPGLDFVARSTAEHPCGMGAPGRGHRVREVDPSLHGHAMTLVVRQEGSRLCYVADGIAEAPVIRVRQGETLTVTLRNEITDPGAIDKLLTVNHLDTANPEVPAAAGFFAVTPGTRHVATGATNLHVHGFAVPPRPPQDEVMDTCTDPASGPVGCGQREYTYHWAIPADMPPGLYWYHPHVHGEVQAQMLMGLVGAIVVEGPADDARRAVGIDDRILVIRQESDLDAARPPAAPARPNGHARPHGKAIPIEGPKVDTEHELGCADVPTFDEIMLNGAPVVDGAAKDADLTPIAIGQGRKQLWRVLNGATDAFLDLGLVRADGSKIPIEVVARDGAPLADDAGHPEKPTPTTESQMVPPAGRIEFLASAPPVGQKAYLVTKAVDTGCAGDKVPARRLALLTTLPLPGVAATQAEPATVPAKSLFSGLLSEKTQRERVMAFAEYPRPGHDDLNDFYIFERRPDARIAPFDMKGPPTVTVEAGAVEEWVIENWTNEIHAFHIHQVHFRVLEVEGRKLADPPLLDTVEVPYATPADPKTHSPAIPGRVRIKLAFPASLAGDILFHCHLVDHEDAGMMGMVRVTLPGETPGTAPMAMPPAAPPMRKASLMPDGLDQTAICRSRS